MPPTSDVTDSRAKRRLLCELRPRKMHLQLPGGLFAQIAHSASKVGLTPEQWLIVAAFEKLRREVFHQKGKKMRGQASAVRPAPKTSDFFLNLLRQRNAKAKKQA